MIDQPGVYPDIPEAVYHADPAPSPSLSSSIAKLLLAKSPRHAWCEHPRLNPDWQPENKTAFDIGKAAHKLLLGKGADLVTIYADDWRTKDAKEKRQAAWDADKIPLLATDMTRVEAMAKAARAQLDQHEDASFVFKEGKPETTLLWQEGDVWCRCRLDWWPADGVIFHDLKTTSTSANPDSFGRTLYDLGYDIQAAFYRRGIRACLNIADPIFDLVVIETTPPHALSVIGLPPSAVEIGDAKVAKALQWWRWCLENDCWPGYPRRTVYCEPPGWQMAAWEERQVRDAMLSERGSEALFEMALQWQAPLTDKGDAA